MLKILSFFLFFLFLFSSSLRASDPADSVGALYKKTNDMSLIFSCTITSIDSDMAGKDYQVLLTANHCVDIGQKYYLVTFDNATTFHTAELFMVPRNLPDDPKDVDLALLKVKRVEGLPVLKVESEENIKTGLDILTTGFPLGIAKISYQGYVAGKVDNIGNRWNNYLILQIFGAPGSSGTAVISKNGEKVVGVLIGATQTVGTPVIYATPISYVKYLMTPRDGRKARAKDSEDNE